MNNYEHEVRLKIEKQPHLLPLFTNSLDMPRRIRDYDSSFFVAYNTNRGKYEIHSLDYPDGQTLSTTIPYGELDERAMVHLWENDIRVHGKEIFRRLEASEERARQQKEREMKNFTHDFAKEFQTSFAKDAWTN
jgi:hypothetical protein